MFSLFLCMVLAPPDKLEATRVLKPHHDHELVSLSAASLSPDGKRLLTAANQDWKVWSTEGQLHSARFLTGIARVEYGQDVIGIASTGELRLFDARKLSPLQTIDISGAWALGNGRSTAYVKEGAVKISLSESLQKTVPLAKGEMVQCMTFGVHGSHLFVSVTNEDEVLREVRCFDVVSGGILWKSQERADHLHCDPQGKTLVCSSEKGNVSVRDALTGALLAAWNAIESKPFRFKKLSMAIGAPNGVVTIVEEHSVGGFGFRPSDSTVTVWTRKGVKTKESELQRWGRILSVESSDNAVQAIDPYGWYRLK